MSLKVVELNYLKLMEATIHKNFSSRKIRSQIEIWFI